MIFRRQPHGMPWTARSADYDPFPYGHYIHPFHQGQHYSREKGKEHPRTVRILSIAEAFWFDQMTALL